MSRSRMYSLRLTPSSSAMLLRTSRTPSSTLMFRTAISAPLVSLYDGKCITVIQNCTRVGVGVSPRLVETVSTGRELATDDAQPARHGESVAKLLEVMRSALRQPRL